MQAGCVSARHQRSGRSTTPADEEPTARTPPAMSEARGPMESIESSTRIDCTEEVRDMSESDAPPPIPDRSEQPRRPDPFVAARAAIDAVATLLHESQRGRAIADHLDTLAMHAAWRTVTDLTRGRDSSCFDAELLSAAAEIGIATRASDRTVLRRIYRAVDLHERFPATAARFSTGAVTLAHVEAIIDEGQCLLDDDALLAEYEADLLDRAPECTPGQLRSAARRVAAELDPAGFAERHGRAKAERHVRVDDLADGMSLLTALLPSTVAHAIHDRLTELARTCDRERDAWGRDRPGGPLGPDADAPVVPWCRCTGEPGCACRPDDAGCGCDAPDHATSSGLRPARGAGDRAEAHEPDDEAAESLRDERRFDEMRADALADLLLAGRLDARSPHAAINGIRGRVAITVPALTLVGVDDEPAMLDGVGPIPLDAAKALCAGASVWLRLLTDPATGEAITADAYRPTAELRRFVETRDQHCRAPGCRRAAIRCDFDHTLAHAEGGPTSSTNGAMLCRRHHTMKHRGWRLVQSRRGALTWISPSGRRRASTPNRAARPWTAARLAEFRRTA